MNDTVVVIYNGEPVSVPKEVADFLEQDRKRQQAQDKQDDRHLSKSEFETVLFCSECVRRPVEDEALRNLRLENLRKAVDGLDDQGQDLIRLRYDCPTLRGKAGGTGADNGAAAGAKVPGAAGQEQPVFPSVFLPTSLKSYLDGRLGRLEDRLSSLIFKQAVEQDMVCIGQDTKGSAEKTPSEYRGVPGCESV